MTHARSRNLDEYFTVTGLFNIYVIQDKFPALAFDDRGIGLHINSPFIALSSARLTEKIQVLVLRYPGINVQFATEHLEVIADPAQLILTPQRVNGHFKLAAVAIDDHV